MSGCEACRAVLWDPGDGYTQFRESQDHHHALLRAERERVKRLEKALRSADSALLLALSDLMGYEDGSRTSTQDLVRKAASEIQAALREAEP